MSEEDFPLPDVMPRVNGSPFRCECGCNVFRRHCVYTNILQCNSCSSRFTTEDNSRDRAAQ